MIGKFTVFDESFSIDELLKVLIASVSYSGVSPAIELGNQIYLSGDTIYENDVLSVINRCEQLGYKEEDIVIDTIVSGNRDISEYDSSSANAYDVLRRSFEVFKYYQDMHGIMRAIDGHGKVNFRYVVGPQFKLPSKIIPMSYTENEAKNLLIQGERDTERTIFDLLYQTDKEISRRIQSPMEIRYYNPER